MVALVRGVLSTIGALYLMCAAITPITAAPTRHALLIGVDKYSNLPQRLQLTTPVNDAGAFGQVLGQLGFKVKVLPNPGLDEMAVAINQISAELQPGDTVIFFFAGHGAAPDGTNLLLPSDVPIFDVRNPAAKDLVRKHSYAETDVISKFQTKLRNASGQQDGLIILVSDACRDNPFLNSGPSFTRSTGGVDQNTQAKATAGIFSIYAAGFGQGSVDHLPDEGGSAHSVFMRVFLDKIATPGETLADIIGKVRQGVKDLAATAIDFDGTPHLQTVAYYDETSGGPIFLANASPLHQPSNEITYKTLNNRDINGGDYRTVARVDLNTCVTECRANVQCQAFSYDKWNRWCFLKTNLSDLLLDPRSVTGIRQGLSTPRTSSIQARIKPYRNKIFLGDGYKSVAARSYETCERSCQDDLSCVVFTFLKNENRCKFFRLAGEYFPDTKGDSGVKSQTDR
jgi:hypothetical protein